MIDTLSMAENLTAAGIEQKQAKAIAQAIGERHSETASKQDTDALKQNIDALKQDTNALKQDTDALKQNTNALKQNTNALKQDIDALKESMNAQFAAIKWIVGAHAGLTLVLLAAFLAG